MFLKIEEYLHAHQTSLENERHGNEDLHFSTFNRHIFNVDLVSEASFSKRHTRIKQRFCVCQTPY